MTTVRNAAVAGRFYNGSAAGLQKDVDGLLASVKTSATPPKVIVAPHAGYVYSGQVAAQVYARLREARNSISRVVLLGPAHRVGFRGIASSSAEAFDTPLGRIMLDRQSLHSVAELPGMLERDDAHEQEHSLEVHLPFLQRCLDQFTLVPLVVGDAGPGQVAKVLNALWGGPETLIVVSTDLSHFLAYDDAVARDLATADRIESLQPALTGDQACGCRPLNGLLMVLRQRGLRIRRVDYKNSGDTAGTRDRVVGYGAWVVNENDQQQDTDSMESADEPFEDAPALSLAQRQQLLQLAREAIMSGFNKQNLDIALARYHAALHDHRGSFVTINHAGRLRGCIGSLAPTRPLVVDVAHNALSAAFKDPRFKPLTQAEYPGIELHISVLSPARSIDVASREALLEFLRPGHHGLILQQGSKRATYLPSVWEKIPEPEQFVSELRAKAGLSRDGWSDDMEVSIYTTEEFA